jgi:hypothetical protein
VLYHNCLEGAEEMEDEELLKKLGFTDHRAKYITEKIQSSQLQITNHIRTLDFAHIFVHNLFKYDLLLTNELSSLPDRSKETGNIYSASVFANRAGTREIKCCNFQLSDQVLTL